MRNLTNLFLAGSLLAFFAAATAAEQAPTVTTTALQGPLHLLQGKGGNVLASQGPDGLLIIDDDYAELVVAYQQALDQLAGAGASVRFVVNTHWHFDHAGGNAYWGERGAVIMAHENVRTRMSTRQELKALGRVSEPSPPAALPVVTYGDSAALHFNGDDIELQHYPHGHTDGDTVVFFSGENLVHTGDLFFKDRFPFVDIESGGNVFSYIANVEAVLSRMDDDTVVIPGHGSVASKADFARYLDMLQTTSALVVARLEQGMSLAEVTAAGLGPEWASWGGGFIDEARWISFIAASR